MPVTTKKQVLILGAGHAGSSAALAAASHLNQRGKESDVEITVIDRSTDLTIKPRLYEYELEATQVPLKGFLSPVGVNVLTANVENLDLLKREITCRHANEIKRLTYDALVVTLGSQLQQPTIQGIELTYNIDSFEAAKKLRDDLVRALMKKKPLKIAILGGGITGLELATELPVTFKKIAAQYNINFPTPKIFLLDRHVISKNVGLSAKEPIKEALAVAQVHCVDNASISKIESGQLRYNQTEVLAADFIISTLGVHANSLADQLKQPVDAYGRVYVNHYLQLADNEDCFVAGDIAHAKPATGRDPVMSCQQGRPQGRLAGYNAISRLLNQPMSIYSQPNYVTCIDLGAFGAVLTEGWDRKLVEAGRATKKLKQHINQERIYPPANADRKALLVAGALEFIPLSSSYSED
jgi:NADH:ubiquinone reductase (H+-translocating)